MFCVMFLHCCGHQACIYVRCLHESHVNKIIIIIIIIITDDSLQCSMFTIVSVYREYGLFVSLLYGKYFKIKNKKYK